MPAAADWSDRPREGGSNAGLTVAFLPQGKLHAQLRFGRKRFDIRVGRAFSTSLESSSRLMEKLELPLETPTRPASKTVQAKCKSLRRSHFAIEGFGQKLRGFAAVERQNAANIGKYRHCSILSNVIK